MYVKDCTVLLSWCMAWSVECGGRMWSVVLRVGNWRKEDEEREEKTVLRYYYYYYYCYKKNPTNHNEWLPHKIVIWCCYVITHSCFLSSSFPKYYFFIVCFSFSFGTECEEHKKNLALNLCRSPCATLLISLDFPSLSPTPLPAVGVPLGGIGRLMNEWPHWAECCCRFCWVGWEWYGIKRKVKIEYVERGGIRRHLTKWVSVKWEWKNYDNKTI